MKSQIHQEQIMLSEITNVRQPENEDLPVLERFAVESREIDAEIRDFVCKRIRECTIDIKNHSLLTLIKSKF